MPSRALPRTFARVDAADGTEVGLLIGGEAGGGWLLRREDGQWHLYIQEAGDPSPASLVTFDQETAWRLFTRGIDPQTALQQSTIAGDYELGLNVFDTVSMLV